MPIENDTFDKALNPKETVEKFLADKKEEGKGYFLRDIDRSTDYYNKITLGFTLPSVFKVPSGYGMED